jgi:hypothetical protein
MPFLDGNFRPITGFTYEVTTTGPGHFTVPGFNVNVNGRPVSIPAASLDVIADPAASAPGRQIWLRSAETNLYPGEPFRIRALLPAAPGNEIQTLSELQINGDGLIPDKTTLRQMFNQLKIDGQPRQIFTYELTVTPIATGTLQFSVQGFSSSPRNFGGAITITGTGMISGGPPNYVLLVSDALAVNVRPLPEGQLPGFTGSMGKFILDQPQLSTNTVYIGQPLHLQISVHGGGDLSRLLPPLPPRSADWQVIADEPGGMGFTLIPLADDIHATPEIPYSSFDPMTGQYVDLTVPPLPVTVLGEGLPVQLTVTDEKDNAAPLKLSGLATAPGYGTGSLQPPQRHGWVVGLLLLPVIIFLALMRWDRHRRFLEAHPEIVRRRQARVALRREKRLWRAAITRGDAVSFVHCAANAMRIACAPHFPALPRALVGADVLTQLEAADQAGVVGDTVRKIFALDDAKFAVGQTMTVDMLALEAKVDTVLMKLEEKL